MESLDVAAKLTFLNVLCYCVIGTILFLKLPVRFPVDKEPFMPGVVPPPFA
jgi:hypothetical protein